MKKILYILSFLIFLSSVSYANNNNASPFGDNSFDGSNINQQQRNNENKQDSSVEDENINKDNSKPKKKTSDLDKPFNKGYAERYGVIGIFGNLPDFINKSFQDNTPGGGGFIYYNILNDFWGNFSIGLSAEYLSGTHAAKNNSIKGYIHMAPFRFLSLAYFTSSDVINFWAGIGPSYNFITYDVKGGGANNGNNGLLPYSLPTSHIDKGLWGVEAFAGIEFLFSKDARWGLFFEFKYNYSESLKINVPYADGSNRSYETSIDTQHMRYALGFSYHY